MLTVRYPNGTTVVYNEAMKVEAHPEGVFLVDAKRIWSCFIPRGSNVVVEQGRPCGVHGDDEKAVERMANNPVLLRRLHYWTLDKLKKALRKYNMKTGRWMR